MVLQNIMAVLFYSHHWSYHVQTGSIHSQKKNRFDYVSRTLHTPMVYREIQVYGTIPQLLGVCYTCNSNIFLYDPIIINSLFSCYNDFLLHLESLLNIFKCFILLPYLSKYAHIHSNLWLKYIWSWKNHHTRLHSMDYIHQHVQYPIS